MVTTPLAGAMVAGVGARTTIWLGLGIAGVGLPLMLSPRLGLVIAGMALVGVGTFLAQAAATGFVSRTADTNRAAASGLYLASYYLGGLVGAALLGSIFGRYGWSACVAAIAGSLLLAAGLGRLITLR
jgi:predicted MFS family arabinose efflux permease